MLAGAEPEAVQASAVIGPTRVDMSFAGLLRFPGDVLALVDCSFVAPFRTELEVVGSAGTIQVSHPFKPEQRERCWSCAGTRSSSTPSRPLPSMSRVRRLRPRRPRRGDTVVTLADSRGNIAALLAVLEAARRHTVRPAS